MVLAIPQEGRNRARDAIAGIITHLALSTATQAFADTDDEADEPGTGQTTVVKAATVTTPSNDTITVSAVFSGADVGGPTVFATVSILTSSNPDDILTRYVRAAPIGIETADGNITVAQNYVVSDAG